MLEQVGEGAYGRVFKGRRKHVGQVRSVEERREENSLSAAVSPGDQQVCGLEGSAALLTQPCFSNSTEIVCDLMCLTLLEQLLYCVYCVA